MGRFPARIHVLLAREAAVGVVIRRGPSKQVCAVLWDRKRDEFHVGQWLMGHIYERRTCRRMENISLFCHEWKVAI